MTPKQQRFVEEYLIDCNATQAAIRAGYSPKTANEQGCRLLANVSISDAVAAGRAKLTKKAEITAERVIAELGKLAFLDIRKAFHEDGNLKPIHEIDDDTSAAISGLEVESIYGGRGEDRDNIGTIKKIKLSDKRGALDSLAKILGMVTDKLDVKQAGELTIIKRIIRASDDRHTPDAG